MARPILLLEINEVPWKLIDRFKSHPDLLNIKRFFEKAQTYTTITVDTGELSPWITWPSLHRGLSNQEHGIAYLGQDPKTFKGTPIWEEFLTQGHSIGICGSLQSWPPQDPGVNGFYVPDTFAHDEACIPKYVETFQRFNLAQTRANGRVIRSRSLLSMEFLKLLIYLPRLGISRRTLWLAFMQLLQEFFDKTAVARRPIFQGILFWDLFKKLYNSKSPPDFSTYFTNHIASCMHRYWHNVFPEDFGELYRHEPQLHLPTMLFALKTLDHILGDTLNMLEKNPEITVVFATSMGQAAILRPEHEGIEISISEVQKLMHIFGLDRDDYKPLLAMVPQIAVQIEKTHKRAELNHLLQLAKTSGQSQLFRVEEKGQSLSITLINPRKKDIESGFFWLENKKIQWEQAGIQVHLIDAGTGYHIPEGILAIVSRELPPSDLRTKISAKDVKEFLLNLAGLKSDRTPIRRAF